MKKIAADRNYRILKRASNKTPTEMPPGGWNRHKESQRRLANIKMPNLPGGEPMASAIFMTILRTDLIAPACGAQNGFAIYGEKCEAAMEKALSATEDVARGMKSPLWQKYKEPLFAEINKMFVPEDKKAAIEWITSNNERLKG